MRKGRLSKGISKNISDRNDKPVDKVSHDVKKIEACSYCGSESHNWLGCQIRQYGDFISSQGQI